MGGGSSTEKDTALQAKKLCKAAIRADPAMGSYGIVDREHQVIQAFESWDTDNNGTLCMEELVGLFEGIGFFSKEEEGKDKKLSALLADIDTDKDGKVNYQELVGYIFQAPYLKEYKEYSKKVCTDHILARMKEADPAKREQLREKQQKQYQKELTPIIKKIYDWHDKDGSGRLDRDESVTFFANYCAILPDLHKHLVHETQIGGVQGAVNAINKFREWKQNNEDQKTRLDQKFRKAFAIVDVGKDGNLAEHEVIELLMHNSTTNMEVLKALEVPALEIWQCA